MNRNRQLFDELESLDRLFKRPDETDIFNMVWHILAPDDYIRQSTWIISSRQEATPLLTSAVDFINNTPTYTDRRGAAYQLRWRTSAGIVLAAGTAGIDYELTNCIVTNSGRSLSRTGNLSVVDRYPDIDRFENTARFQS